MAASEDSDDSENEDSEGDFEKDRENESADAIEDLFVLSSGSVGVKTFNHINVTEDSPFVEVYDGYGNIVVVRK